MKLSAKIREIVPSQVLSCLVQMINMAIMSVREAIFVKMVMPLFVLLVINVMKKVWINLFHVLMALIIGKRGRLNVAYAQLDLFVWVQELLLQLNVDLVILVSSKVVHTLLNFALLALIAPPWVLRTILIRLFRWNSNLTCACPPHIVWEELILLSLMLITLNLPKNAKQVLIAEREQRTLMVRVNAGLDTIVPLIPLNLSQLNQVSFLKVSEMRNKNLAEQELTRMNMEL